MLPNEITNKKLKPHKYYNKFINIKDEFNYFYNKNAKGTACIEKHCFSIHDYCLFNNKNYVFIVKKGMIDMLKILKINLTGIHHSGIDDTRNITKILLHMIKDGHHDYKFNYVK